MDLERGVGAVHVALFDFDCYCYVYSFLALCGVGGNDDTGITSTGFILCQCKLFCRGHIGGIVFYSSLRWTGRWPTGYDGVGDIAGTGGVGDSWVVFGELSGRDGRSDELVAENACMGSNLSP